MFAENIKNILSSFASRWQLMGFVNDPEVTMIAEEIERVLRKNDWTNDSLKELIDIAADVDRRVRLITADKKIIIYGVGKNTISFMNEYEEYLQDRIVGMAVTQKNNDNSLFAGKYPVKRIEDYVDEKNEVVVLVTPSGNNKKEIIAKLTDLGFSNIIDVEIVSR
jgi:galactitol-specific phosphotransferase system IIB component